MTKAGFRKCLQDKVVREPRNCDSDKGGEHRGLKQEQDIQQLRGGRRNRQKRHFRKDNSVKKAETGVSMLVCTSSDLHTGGTTKCWGSESCHAPLMLIKRKPFRKLLVLF